MRDKDDEIIYIGKAKNLKNRVKSYFHSTKARRSCWSRTLTVSKRS
jgi:excinuclease UvrABC nuclease subunit